MRLAMGLVLALLVNFALFSLMHTMSSTNKIAQRLLADVQLLDFVRVKRETPITNKQRVLPKKPPPLQQPPPPPQAPMQSVKAKSAPPPKLIAPNLDLPLNFAGGPYLGDFAAPSQAIGTAPSALSALEGEVIPLVRIPPNYPRAALRRGIEGTVTLSFTITTTGTVKDPIVISTTHKDTFNKAALSAILKWKFKSQVIDGQPVERQATQEIEFKLAR